MRFSSDGWKAFACLVLAAASAVQGQFELPKPAAKPRTAFNTLPRGKQTFDGVDFQVHGPVNVIGMHGVKAHGPALARATDSTIHGHGQYIHVLHTGDFKSSPHGTYLWRLVLHYVDGESRRFDFAYGIHIRDYWRRPGDTDLVPNDPDSAIVWTGTSAESDRKSADLVVSRTSLTNPRPDVEVVSADFVSLLGPSSAYVFAVTFSDAGPKPTGTGPPPARNAPVLPFKFENAQGQVDSNVVLTCRFEVEGFMVRLAPAHTDAKGRIEIDIPTDVVSILQYSARNAAGKTESGRIEIAPGDSGWRPHVVRFGE